MSGHEEQLMEQHGELSEDTVREYLKTNSDFLQRNPDLLDYLHVSHATGSAVSLVEKQVSVLRERNVEMRHRLNSLTSNARSNDQLYEKTRKLLLSLLEADNLPDLDDAFTQGMKQDFQAEHASLILFGDKGNAEGEPRVEEITRARDGIGALIRGRRAVCGALREEELAFLFPRAGSVGSAAVAPMLGEHELGVIAVGSSDASRYSSDMGTLFLGHIADVLVRLIPRLAQDAEAA